MPQSVDRALDVLDVLAEADGPVPAKVLARRLGCGLSTAYELLGALTARGHLARTPAGYVLGYRVPALHHAFQRQMRIGGEVQELLLELRRAVGTDAYLSGYRDGTVAVLAATGSGPAATGGFAPGRDEAAHATAHGKVLLAALPRAARHRYLAAAGLPAITPRTITSPERLEAQLRRVRREGMAMEIEECAAGVACLAVPVPAAGTPATAVSVALPAAELARRRGEVLAALRQVAATAGKLTADGLQGAARSAVTRGMTSTTGG
ncbi:IclR family transcriptional regulator [Streptomyces orinoci]|uniref:IclR family transcriptional regulator n=1 Tax=Streptomyces orinoci TaxID=67339 RepID=A0ABV3JS81_STRON|nr:IclR family transcriptional regulator [Streptomyces orinoci]